MERVWINRVGSPAGSGHSPPLSESTALADDGLVVPQQSSKHHDDTLRRPHPGQQILPPVTSGGHHRGGGGDHPARAAAGHPARPAGRNAPLGPIGKAEGHIVAQVGGLGSLAQRGIVQDLGQRLGHGAVAVETDRAGEEILDG